jgi:hypothetical protein
MQSGNSNTQSNVQAEPSQASMLAMPLPTPYENTLNAVLISAAEAEKHAQQAKQNDDKDAARKAETAAAIKAKQAIQLVEDTKRILETKALMDAKWVAFNNAEADREQAKRAAQDIYFSQASQPAPSTSAKDITDSKPKDQENERKEYVMRVHAQLSLYTSIPNDNINEASNALMQWPELITFYSNNFGIKANNTNIKKVETVKNKFLEDIVDDLINNPKKVVDEKKWSQDTINYIARNWKDDLYEILIKKAGRRPGILNRAIDPNTVLGKIFHVKRGIGQYFTCRNSTADGIIGKIRSQMFDDQAARNEFMDKIISDMINGVESKLDQSIIDTFARKWKDELYSRIMEKVQSQDVVKQNNPHLILPDILERALDQNVNHTVGRILDVKRDAGQYFTSCFFSPVADRIRSKLTQEFYQRHPEVREKFITENLINSGF